MKMFGEKEINAMQTFVSTNRSAYHIKYQQNQRQFYWHMGIAALISWVVGLIGSFLIISMIAGRDFDWIEVLLGAFPFFMFTYLIFGAGFVGILITLRNISIALDIYDQRSLKRKISFLMLLRASIGLLFIFICIIPGALLIFPLMFMHRFQYTLWGIVDGYGFINSLKKSWVVSKEVLLTEIFTGKFAGDLQLAQAYVWRYYFPKK